jgi:hypothetical protein
MGASIPAPRPEPATPESIEVMTLVVRIPLDNPCTTERKRPNPPLRDHRGTAPYVPTDAEADAWVRRNSIDQIIAALCLDLGICPSGSPNETWFSIKDTLQSFGHAKGFAQYGKERLRRHQAVSHARDYTSPPWPWDLWSIRLLQPIREMFGAAIGDPSPAPA